MYYQLRVKVNNEIRQGKPGNGHQSNTVNHNKVIISLQVSEFNLSTSNSRV